MYAGLRRAVLTMAELKPCPFCGGDADRKIADGISGKIIIVTSFCKSCGASVKTAYSPGTVNKPKNAIATALRLSARDWNRRDNNG